MAPAIVEPYNAILATHTSLETVDVCFLVDNQVRGQHKVATVDACDTRFLEDNQVSGHHKVATVDACDTRFLEDNQGSGHLWKTRALDVCNT